MSKDPTYTRQQFMDMIKEGLVEMNKQLKSKKNLTSHDYTALGRIGIALQFYDKKKNL